ncbi:MAG: AAA family ATPase [Saprospiraceae bacterium]|nr:AAA family ATPase [Saprospiraceae bacterium]
MKNDNWLSEVSISHFKSISQAKLEFDRINLFVGKPNAGKSNLLEALSMLQTQFLGLSGQKFAKHLIRYEQIADLFYDKNYLEHKVEVSTNGGRNVSLEFKDQQFQFIYKVDAIGQGYSTLNNQGHINTWTMPHKPKFSIGRKYHFPEVQTFQATDHNTFLTPPFGENLLNILQINKTLRVEAGKLFEDYGLELLVDAQYERLEVARRRDGILFKTPFSLVADTLRRYLFHLAAIESNRDAVILFEEPESHNYPPYIQLLAQKIIAEKTNQYFITTHSPFLLNTLVEEATDIAVFVVEVVDYQTKVRRLTSEQLREMLDYGINIFTDQEALV